MNKKKLSVVMAGAMLATSVAPVLAAETTTATEIGLSKKSLLQKEILDLANSKLITEQKTLFTDTNGYVSSQVEAEIGKGGSAYGIKVLNKEGKEVDLKTVGGDNNETVTYDLAQIEKILKSDNKKLVADMTVQVVERGTSTFLGQIIPGSEIKPNGGTSKYETSDFADLENKVVNASSNAFVKDVTSNKTNTEAVVTLEAVKDLAAEKQENLTITLTLESDKLNFDLPIDAKGNLITDNKKVQECVGFATKENYFKSEEIKAEPKVEKEYKLVDDSTKAEEVTYLAKDLYDGLALTAKGTEIQLDLENAKKVAKENNRTAAQTTVKLAGVTDQGSDGITADDIVLNKGVASFTVEYYNSYKEANDPTKVAKVVTIKSTNLKEIQSLYKMLTNGGYEVGIVAGSNRYETAVNVAKAQGITEITSGNASKEGQNDIVLVNGESLVDGLAAAPLAASLSWNKNSNGGTAVLLSKTDSLPKETKEFLESLLVNVSSSKIRNVKIHLVGGESVLSESLVKELKDMGFSVERHGGDNREETSLEVAETVETLAKVKKGAFVVGGNGEADAMSIAAVAANEKTPIIVSSVHGLTKDALKHVKGRADEDITIIGGESVVSAEEYAKLDALTADDNAVVRISGKNRFETNAKIIEEYASNVKNVVLVKDGQSDKGELIDALSAASFAAKNNAPIVLATDKITDSQKIAILNKKDGSGFEKLTQVGQGVARTTLESVAEFLGLSNVK